MIFAGWVQKVKSRLYWPQSNEWNNLISEDTTKQDLISWLNASSCATLPDCRNETQHLLTLLADYVIPQSNADVRRIFGIGNFHKETNYGYMFRRWLELSSPRRNHNEAVQTTQIFFYVWVTVHLISFASVQGRSLFKEMSHHWASGMWNVDRKRIYSRRYTRIRNMYCAQSQNTFQTVHIRPYLQTTNQHLKTKLSNFQPSICNNISS
jgi:hypothetical protein